MEHKFNRLFIIAGPCVIEDKGLIQEVAQEMKKICADLDLPYFFKASYDKANRTSIHSFRGPGLQEGLKLLEVLKKNLDLPILSDVHSVSEIDMVKDCLDVIQIPAFLCRQTDMLVAAAKSGCIVNVKKGQFLAPWDMQHVVKKIEDSECRRIWVTERGSSFGYNNLVSDMRSIPIMKKFGHPVVFDATHSVQLPGGSGDKSAGQREFAATLAFAACASGANGLFFETHPHPQKALSDGPNMIPLADMRAVLAKAKKFYELAQSQI